MLSSSLWQNCVWDPSSEQISIVRSILVVVIIAFLFEFLFLREPIIQGHTLHTPARDANVVGALADFALMSSL